MNHLPIYLPVGFVLTTFLTIWLFYKAANQSVTAVVILFLWLALQSAIGLSGFYTVTDTIPPRFILLLGPPLIFIVGLFTLPQGRKFLDSLQASYLTILHIIRVPVELVLFGLCMYKAIPTLMTFEGRNLDILSGLSAPVIWYLAYRTKQMGRTGLLVWNLTCLALLFNIVVIAILSGPFRFQQFAFDQPNIGLLYFPFVWLPACVVPLVLLSHLAALRQLLKKSESKLVVAP